MIKRIYIEITNICNLKCDFCINHNREYKSLTLIEFKHILYEISGICDYIYLHVQGEPLLHPNLYEFLDEIENRNLKIQLVTNGSLISNNHQLLSYKCLRKISISCHSIDYQKLDYQEYMNNIIIFVKKASVKANTFVELRFWNADNLSDKSLLAMNILKDNFNFEITSKKNSYRILNNCYVHFDNKFQWPSQCDMNNDYIDGTCHGGKMMIAILSNGQVVPCCLDAKGEINLGNIFQDSLKNILSSDRYLDIVKSFNDHKITEDLCKKCTYRLRFNK